MATSTAIGVKRTPYLDAGFAEELVALGIQHCFSICPA